MVPSCILYSKWLYCILAFAPGVSLPFPSSSIGNKYQLFLFVSLIATILESVALPNVYKYAPFSMTAFSLLGFVSSVGTGTLFDSFLNENTAVWSSSFPKLSTSLSTSVPVDFESAILRK